MKRTTAKLLHDALDACREIRDYTDGLNQEQFLQDRKVCRAVERCFEIVGEALKQAANEDDTFIDRFPDLRFAIALRNRIIHGYDTVSDEVIWDIVVSNLPVLTLQIDTLLDEARM